MQDIQDAENIIVDLKSSDHSTRSNAVEMLTQLEHTEVVDFLMQILRKDDAHRLVKEGACKALGNIGDTRATDVIIEALSDTHETVRYQAAIALGRLKDTKAVPILIDIVKRNEDQLVRSEAAKALGMIGDPSALKILLTVLRKDDDKFIRYHAATALGKIGDKKALKDLEKTVKETNDDRLIIRTKEAIDAIETSGNLTAKRIVAG